MHCIRSWSVNSRVRSLSLYLHVREADAVNRCSSVISGLRSIGTMAGVAVTQGFLHAHMTFSTSVAPLDAEL